MHDKDLQLKRSRQTRLKNLTAKKAELGALEPLEEQELQRITDLLASKDSKRSAT